VGIAAVVYGGVVSFCTCFREADQGLDLGKIECCLNECRYGQDEEKCKDTNGEAHYPRVASEEAYGQEVGWLINMPVAVEMMGTLIEQASCLSW
jgi:hypothetical protein